MNHIQLSNFFAILLVRPQSAVQIDSFIPLHFWEVIPHSLTKISHTGVFHNFLEGLQF